MAFTKTGSLTCCWFCCTGCIWSRTSTRCCFSAVVPPSDTLPTRTGAALPSKGELVLPKLKGCWWVPHFLYKNHFIKFQCIYLYAASRISCGSLMVILIRIIACTCRKIYFRNTWWLSNMVHILLPESSVGHGGGGGGVAIYIFQLLGWYFLTA